MSPQKPQAETLRPRSLPCLQAPAGLLSLREAFEAPESLLRGLLRPHALSGPASLKLDACELLPEVLGPGCCALACRIMFCTVARTEPSVALPCRHQQASPPLP